MNKLLDGFKQTQLIDEFNELLTDAEALLQATATQSGEKVVELRNKIGESIRVAKEGINELESVVLHQTKAAAKATDTYVHENPWQSVGVAMAVGFIIGWLVKRD